jgi:hypothetical protein
MTTTNLSAVAAAQAFGAAKSAATRKELAAYVADKARTSPKARWKALHAAIEAGDKARVAELARPAKDRYAEARAKREADAPAKPAPVTAEADLAAALGVTPEALAAFLAVARKPAAPAAKAPAKRAARKPAKQG